MDVRDPRRSGERRVSGSHRGPVTEEGGKRRPVLLAVALLGLLSYAFLPGLLSSLRSKGAPVPPALIGRWVTADPRYADRGFTLTARSLSLERGGGNVAVYPIERIRTLKRDDGQSYELTYHIDGASAVLALHYALLDGEPAIILAHPPDVLWRRQPQP
jgi:hypothetical protein